MYNRNAQALLPSYHHLVIFQRMLRPPLGINALYNEAHKGTYDDKGMLSDRINFHLTLKSQFHALSANSNHPFCQ